MNMSNSWVNTFLKYYFPLDDVYPLRFRYLEVTFGGIWCRYRCIEQLWNYTPVKFFLSRGNNL